MGKATTLKNLKVIVNHLKEKGKKIVFTNGCFDIIHPGHIKVFRQAKSLGDVLIVGLNADSSIQKIKGPQRPILNEKARSQLIAALEAVDYVVLFKETTPLQLIKAIRPHILVKGGDWHTDEIVGSEFVQKVVRIKLCQGYSTTAIIEKIKGLDAQNNKNF